MTVQLVTADTRLSVQTRTWIVADRRSSVVVAKATFALLQQGPVTLTHAAPITRIDTFADERLLRVSEMAPYLAQTDLMVHGAAGAEQVRLVVGRGGVTHLDKAIDGRRDPRLAAMGPIAARWPARATGVDAALLEAWTAGADDVVLPPHLDWAFFHAAPADQRVPHLVGDEWFVLEGMHPSLSRIHGQLCGARAEVRSVARGQPATSGQRVEMAADMLVFDVGAMRCSVVWRGRIKPSDDMWLAAGLALPGAPVDWSRVAPPAARDAGSGTRGIDRDALRDGGRLPWEQAGEAAPPPSTPGETKGIHRDALGEGGRLPWERAGGPPNAQEAPPRQADEASASASEAAPLPWERPGTRAVHRPPQAAGGMPWERPEGDPVPSERGSSSATDSMARPVEGAALPWERPGGASRGPAAEPPPSVPHEEHPQKGSTVSVSADVLREAMDIVAEPRSRDWIPRPQQAEADPAGTKAISRDALHEVVAPFGLAKAGASAPGEASVPNAPWNRAGTEHVAVRPDAGAETKPVARADVLAMLEKFKPTRTNELAAAEGTLIPPRRTNAIPIVNPTSLEVRTLAWQVAPPQHSTTVIAKATYAIHSDGTLTAIEAEPPTGPVFSGDRGAVSYAGDFVPFKPRADVTVVGHAYASDRASEARVRLRFGQEGGGIDRAIRVFGDRFFTPGADPRSLQPRPFDKMPLVYELAYGGPGHADNPVGLGFQAEDTGTPVALPNLLCPDTRGDAVLRPACFAPIPIAWRMAHADAAMFDATWVAERWPYFPDAFDLATLQAAPIEQQLDEIAGDEPFALHGMKPEGAPLEGKLPGTRVRMFAQRTRDAGGEFVELTPRLDTVHFDLDAMRVQLVWRAVLDTADARATDVSSLLVLAGDDVVHDVREARAQHQRLLVELDMTAHEVVAAAAVPAPERIDDLGRARAERALELGGNLTDIDLTDADLSGLDFRGRDLTRAKLRRAKLCACRFDGADLSSAQLSGADAREAVFDSAKLTQADLRGAQLDHARFANAELTDANFASSSGAEVLFLGARGRRTSFESASLQHACFDDAELEDADFASAVIERGSFLRAQLRNVTLLDASANGACFDDAMIDGARGDRVKLRDASLTKVMAEMSVWEEADLSGASFEAARLGRASFVSANCTRTRFVQAVLRSARFSDARLEHATLHRADLMQGSLERANLTGANLEGANLFAVEMHGCIGGAS